MQMLREGWLNSGFYRHSVLQTTITGVEAKFAIMESEGSEGTVEELLTRGSLRGGLRFVFRNGSATPWCSPPFVIPAAGGAIE